MIQFTIIAIVLKKGCIHSCITTISVCKYCLQYNKYDIPAVQQIIYSIMCKYSSTLICMRLFACPQHNIFAACERMRMHKTRDTCKLQPKHKIPGAHVENFRTQSNAVYKMISGKINIR